MLTFDPEHLPDDPEPLIRRACYFDFMVTNSLAVGAAASQASSDYTQEKSTIGTLYV